MSCSEFRDEVGVDLGGHRSALQRLHGDDAVNRVLHTCMAAMLIVLLTPRLLMAAMVLGPVPLLLGAAHRHGGDLLRAGWLPPSPTWCSAARFATMLMHAAYPATAPWKQHLAADRARQHAARCSSGLVGYAWASYSVRKNV